PLYVDANPPVATSPYTNTWQQLTVNTQRELSWSLPLTGTLTDPPLSSGDPGSGVITSTVLVTLIDSMGQIAGIGQPQRAKVSGNTWSVTYRFSGTRPAGRYTIQITAQDLAGNRATTNAGTILLDARPPTMQPDPHLTLPILISTTQT